MYILSCCHKTSTLPPEWVCLILPPVASHPPMQEPPFKDAKLMPMSPVRGNMFSPPMSPTGSLIDSFSPRSFSAARPRWGRLDPAVRFCAVMQHFDQTGCLNKTFPTGRPRAAVCCATLELPLSQQIHSASSYGHENLPSFTLGFASHQSLLHDSHQTPRMKLNTVKW